MSCSLSLFDVKFTEYPWRDLARRDLTVWGIKDVGLYFYRPRHCDDQTLILSVGALLRSGTILL